MRIRGLPYTSSSAGHRALNKCRDTVVCRKDCMRFYIVVLALAAAMLVPTVASATPLVTEKGNLDVMTWLIVKDGDWTRERLATAKIPLESKEKITQLLDQKDLALAAEQAAAAKAKQTAASTISKPSNAVYTADHDIVIANTARSLGYTEDEVSILLWIHHHESSDPTAVSASGKYFGAFQLSASKVQGQAWWDPAVNARIAINYIAERYGTVYAAQAHWLSHNWY